MFEEETGNTDLEEMEKLEDQFGEAAPDPEESDKPTEETPDTETDTPVKEEVTSETSDTDTETLDESPGEDADGPVQKAFKEYGLDQTYADPAAALAAVKEKEAEIGRLHKQQAEDRGREKLPDPQDQSVNDEALGEYYDTDPRAAFIKLARAYEQQGSTVADLQAENSLVRASVKYPDIVENRVELDKIIEGDYLLKYVNTRDPGKALELARAVFIADNPAPKTPVKKTIQVKPVSEETKAGAITTTGQGKTPRRKSGERSQEEWDNMSIEDMEKDPVIGLREI